MQTSQVLQGRYQLQEKLGQNAGRQTWLAIDLQTSPSELVIVKLLAFSPQMQWEDFKLFEREAQVLKELNYPWIPRYRDYFSLDKQTGSGLCWFALVQEYIPGKSLQEMLNQGKRFTEAQVRSLAIQVLEILTYLHELEPPVLHRDIKPSNLIWTAEERVFLVAFGAVQQQAAAEGVTFTVVGTVGYAPLEQFWGKAVPASDLYSLGATLIHLLTGVAPADLPQKNLRIQFSDRVSINPHLLGWIEALTAPDLNQRYNAARDAIADLKTERYPNYKLQKMRQPYGSRIQLWKSPTQLKLEIPGRGIKFLLELLIFGGNLVLAGVVIMSQFSLGFSILVVFLALGFTLFGIYRLGSWVLIILLILLTLLSTGYYFFSQTDKELLKLNLRLRFPQPNSIFGYSLDFNKNEFTFQKKLFGWSYIRQHGNTFNIQSVKKIFSKGVAIKTQLGQYYIWEGLTESERNWVVQQIQDWLE